MLPGCSQLLHAVSLALQLFASGGNYSSGFSISFSHSGTHLSHLKCYDWHQGQSQQTTMNITALKPSQKHCSYVAISTSQDIHSKCSNFTFTILSNPPHTHFSSPLSPFILHSIAPLPLFLSLPGLGDSRVTLKLCCFRRRESHSG